jgi:5,10-methenyltetrahydrofolate synthetase
MSSKQALRQQYLAQRNACSRRQIITDSLAILAYLKPMIKGQLVGLYVPIQNEVDVSLLFRDDIALPSIEEGRLVFRRYVEPLVPGKFGTMESTGERCEPTLVVVPGIAFSRSGARLGYGKGYYDVFLSKCRKDVIKVGLSFFEPIQKIEDTRAEDVPLDFLVTPSGGRRF